MSSGSLVRTFQGHDGHVGGVTVSRDGRLLASAGLNDKTVRLWDVFTGKELAKFTGHAGAVRTVAFSPDGTRLASGSNDTTILLWDISRFKATPPATATDDKTLARLWGELHGREAAKPYEALWSLVGAGDAAVAALAERLQPVPPPEPAKVRRLLADLDADDFHTRGAAAEALVRMGPSVEPELRRALAAGLSVDAKKRLREVLGGLRTRDATEEELRQERAVLALELIGTKAARELLQKLASAAEGVVLTHQAKAALGRLDRAAKGPRLPASH